MTTLFTIGYNAWTARERMERMVHALLEAGVTMLVDIRHSPCPSDPSGRTMYGPKPWSLQQEGGLLAELEKLGLRYAWLLELGNPQKNDREMAILKWHLADRDHAWPVHRGLLQLGKLVGEGHVCCLLCACAKYDQCHRQLIVDAFCHEITSRPRVVNLSSRGPHEILPGTLS
jgi:uncharacterized protein (DUF488 family)